MPPVPSLPARRVSAKNLPTNSAGPEAKSPVSEKIELPANRIRSWTNTPEESAVQANWKAQEEKCQVKEEKKIDETITSSFLDNLSDTSHTTPITDSKNKESDKPAGLNKAIIVIKPSSSSDSNSNQQQMNVKQGLNRQNSNDPTIDRPPGRLNYYDSDTNTISEGLMITSNLIKRSNSEHLQKKTKCKFLHFIFYKISLI